jgi:GNAT superfamily N-acetyltransferase
MRSAMTEPSAYAESAEAAFWATYARNIPTTDETRDTGAVSVAGGYAICLQGTSLDYGLAVGCGRPLRPDDLRIVDEFYGHRGLRSRLELHPDVVARDGALLAEWGYDRELDVVVLERELTGEAGRADGEIRVEAMTGRRAEWIDVAISASVDAVVPGERGRLRRTTLACAAAAHALFGARVDGRLAGVAALGVTGEAAFLFAAAVLPEFRRSGAHAALIAARLRYARSRGAVCAFMKAPAGSPAIAGAEQSGFVPAYTRHRLRKA